MNDQSKVAKNLDEFQIWLSVIHVVVLGVEEGGVVIIRGLDR